MKNNPSIVPLHHSEAKNEAWADWERRQLAVTAKAGPIFAHLVEFLPNSFTAVEFSYAGIACPETIQRSVYKRQVEFFFGRLAAREALFMLGLADEQVPIGTHGQPIWPSGVIGSITHTIDLAAAVATRLGTFQGIGIDIEKLIDLKTCQSVTQVVIDRYELNYLRSIQDLSLQITLTLVFSAKESFYKAAYATVGRIFDFSAVKVAELDLRKQQLILILNETLSDQFCRGNKYEARFIFVRPDTVFTYVTW